jgi:phosphinothricin acetyltransferase
LNPIRPSVDADIAAITAIYGYYVLNATATFETEVPSAAEIARRREVVLSRRLPYLVAEIDGQVVGFAYAGPYRPRPAYRYTLENSVYVHPSRARQGVGRSLLDELLLRSTEGGWRQMVAVIGDSQNVASIRLHEAAGFTHAGLLRSVGIKFGRWLDTVLMQKALGTGDSGLPDEI